MTASIALKHALLVAGLGFGDEGKGSVVDWLTRQHAATAKTLVVRYNGGPQAAHHVVTQDGTTHCFSQLGAGMLVPQSCTFLSRFMVVDPLALFAEVQALQGVGVRDIWARLQLDPRCVVVTPFHRILNQMQEVARGSSRHGSCGRGVGQALLDSEKPGLPVLRIGDLFDHNRLRAQLKLQWLVKLDQAEQLLSAAEELHAALQPSEHRQLQELLVDLRNEGRVPALAEAFLALPQQLGITIAEQPHSAHADVAIFEGAQGVLLDRSYGFFPHVTPSRTTFVNAHALLKEWQVDTQPKHIGVLRAYATRHGAGPLPTEDAQLTAQLPDPHNGSGPWQGPFRVGHFDAVLARHALAVVAQAQAAANPDDGRSTSASTRGIDSLIITCLDRLVGQTPLQLADGYMDPSGVLHRTLPLPPTSETSTQAAAQQTQFLQRLHPHYRALHSFSEPGLPAAAQAYLAAIGEELGVPVAAVSLGRTAQDKRNFSVGA